MVFCVYNVGGEIRYNNGMIIWGTSKINSEVRLHQQYCVIDKNIIIVLKYATA